MNKILFSIPGLYNSREIVLYLFDLINRYPEKFNEDCEIDSVYGNFPNIMNGGRSLSGDFSYKDVADTVKIFNELGIRVRYTFTNSKLTANDMKDRISNMILMATLENQTMKNDVNIASNVVKRLLNEKYPNKFNIVYSTTLCLKEADEINKYSKNNIVVPDYNINKNFEVLKKLEYPENIELLANETCFSNCPIRKEHYDWYSKRNFKENSEPFKCFFQSKNNSNYYRENKIRSHYIQLDEIREKYLPLGINKFKLIGRNEPITKAIEGYVDYLVKPEFQDEIRCDLINFAIKAVTGQNLIFS